MRDSWEARSGDLQERELPRARISFWDQESCVLCRRILAAKAASFCMLSLASGVDYAWAISGLMSLEAVVFRLFGR